MRSTQFVVLSILLHSLCVAALALTPRTLESGQNSNTVEVNIGEPAEQSGEASAPATEVAPVAKKVAPIKTAKSKPAKSKQPTKITAVATPSEDQDAPVEEDVLTPIKETTPAGVEAATEEVPEPLNQNAEVAPEQEAAPVAVVAQEPAPQAAPAPQPTPVAAATTNAEESSQSTKGGATKSAAVSYLDLKQMPGNKLPAYPMKARLENRQGLLELIYRVTREGTVADVQVVKSSGSKDLDDSAIAAISTYKFVAGQEGWARHPVVFSLKGAATSAASLLRVKPANQAQAE